MKGRRKWCCWCPEAVHLSAPWCHLTAATYCRASHTNIYTYAQTHAHKAQTCLQVIHFTVKRLLEAIRLSALIADFSRTDSLRKTHSRSAVTGRLVRFGNIHSAIVDMWCDAVPICATNHQSVDSLTHNICQTSGSAFFRFDMHVWWISNLLGHSAPREQHRLGILKTRKPFHHRKT